MRAIRPGHHHLVEEPSVLGGLHRLDNLPARTKPQRMKILSTRRQAPPEIGGPLHFKAIGVKEQIKTPHQSGIGVDLILHVVDMRFALFIFEFSLPDPLVPGQVFKCELVCRPSLAGTKSDGSQDGMDNLLHDLLVL